MLTKFRRLFARKAPLELEVYRRSNPEERAGQSTPEASEVATGPQTTHEPQDAWGPK